AGGKRYTHIFNPKSGQPLPWRGAGVTVILPDATSADAFATAFFVLGVERSIEIAETAGIAVMWLEATAAGGLRSTTSSEFRRITGTGGAAGE
ncbi:MAG TPA: FAD:protein FMN transferase, partial [Planctomycetes bacterium]|nr:FAD:protein FMN transferase [Planctomycetota bacterium]